MAKFSSSYFLFLLVVSSGTLWSRVKGDLCWEDLGACDNNCNSHCISNHPGGKGSCDGSAGGPATKCICYFDCGQPPPVHKICNVGIGPCSQRCNDECCNQNCAAMFAGREGRGICYNPVGPYNACLCLFNC